MSQAFDADVAIIGYGPTGVSAANFLGSRGVRAIAFERDADIYARARAVTINDWTMRIYQSVGLDVPLKRDMDETYALRWITYDGQELSRVGFPPSELGHARSYAIYQPEMEKTLRAGAARYKDHVVVNYGVEVSGLVQDADGVTLTVTDTKTGTTRQSRVRYVLACDGGSSSTREQLGIGLIGDTLETRWVVIDAKVKRWWPNRHILTFWSDKFRPVVDIALSMGNHRWEFPLGPDESESDFATHDQLWQLLDALGVSRDDIEIHQHAFYKHHVRHAERWRDGRVMLLGDAAHLMPPWAGSGMQSGVRDADNICWKLAAVLNGSLPETVLDTYQLERAPDVARYTQISVELGRIIKQELSPEEVAAMQPSPDAPPQLPPLLQLPTLQQGWVNADTQEASPIGKYIPQPRVATTNGQLTLLDEAIGNGFVMLGDGVAPETLLTPEQKRGWDALGTRYKSARAPDQPSLSEDDVIDIDGSLLSWMRQYQSTAIAVRPDRFVAAAQGYSLSVPFTQPIGRE
jgi:3-(3-hydroxy-phenyl)propionate hydroxylase